MEKNNKKEVASENVISMRPGITLDEWAQELQQVIDRNNIFIPDWMRAEYVQNVVERNEHE